MILSDPATAVQIKDLRQYFGMSCQAFDQAMGYKTDGRITMALEAGTRDGKPFILSGSARQALTLLMGVERIVRLHDIGNISAAEAIDECRMLLPKEML